MHDDRINTCLDWCINRHSFYNSRNSVSWNCAGRPGHAQNRAIRSLLRWSVATSVDRSRLGFVRALAGSVSIMAQDNRKFVTAGSLGRGVVLAAVIDTQLGLSYLAFPHLASLRCVDGKFVGREQNVPCHIRS
jgi:hypothetical protein